MAREDDSRRVMLESSLRMYPTAVERVSMRSGMGDAAGLCDAVAADILQENRGHGGVGATTKKGRELAAIAKRCGDAIWAMRQLVEVNRDNDKAA